MFRRKYSVGFTLIELLVVVAIMGVISITGIAAFVAYDRSQKLNNATLDVVSMLNSAKARTQSQVKPQLCIDAGNTLAGYEVNLCALTTCISTQPGVDYELNVVCKNSLDADVKHNILYKNLPNEDYSFTGSTTSTIFFPVLKGGVEGDGTITIDNGEGDTQDIDIDTGGNIKIE